MDGNSIKCGKLDANLQFLCQFHLLLPGGKVLQKANERREYDLSNSKCVIEKVMKIFY